MPDKLLLALAQLNPSVGDIDGNLEKLRQARRQAALQGAQLLFTSELYLTGYPPEDLVLKPSFINDIHAAVDAFARETSDGGPAVLLGSPWKNGDKLYNACLLLRDGRVTHEIFKCDLPNYGPFDEKRVFTPGSLPMPIDFGGFRLGVMICEDMWTSQAAMHLKKHGAHMLLVPNGSPYESDKPNERETLARARVRETGLPLIYLNQVGGQDELVFDGASFMLDADGRRILQMGAWNEDFAVTRWSLLDDAGFAEQGAIKDVPQGEASLYHALMQGLRDYVRKNAFEGVVLGLSGGIDSALVAALAVDALGADKVWAVMLPSPYTSPESIEDASMEAKALGCRFDSISIVGAMETFGMTLRGIFGDRTPDVTEENIQARCRGMILMALSNKFGPMVLSTGNKSEMSVGYSTLYGDLCGGFAVLKDLYKTQVYKVARWRNAQKPSSALGPEGAVIPERVFTKPPTAELKPNQTDQDSLPPYDKLDDILECLIEKDMGIKEVAMRGHAVDIVKRIWGMIDRAEYKRRQAPPGVKVTRRHMGIDRRYPITNRYGG